MVSELQSRRACRPFQTRSTCFPKRGTLTSDAIHLAPAVVLPFPLHFITYNHVFSSSHPSVSLVTSCRVERSAFFCFPAFQLTTSSLPSNLQQCQHPTMARKRGKAKKAALAKPTSKSSPPVVPRVHGPEHVHPPNSEVILTLEHSLEIVKTVITATVRCHLRT